MFKKLLAILTLFVATSFAQTVPRSKHVYIVAEENKSYEHIVGSANMPYLNSIIKQGGLATQFYANQHGSLQDYFWVTAGMTPTQNNQTLAIFNIDNPVRHALVAGLTYKSYAESLPSTGFAGLTAPGGYLKRHCPFPYFSDMGNSTTEMQKHVDLVHFDNDVLNGNLPNLAFITPNGLNDMHDCPSGLIPCLQKADNWLKTHIAPLLARPEFQAGGDGLLIIWADEADLSTDNRCSSTVSTGCGGRVAVALIGPKVKTGFQSTKLYHHQSVERLIYEALGMVQNGVPAAGATAPSMAEFFKASVVATSIKMTTPVQGAVLSNLVAIKATTAGTNPVVLMNVWIDGVKKYEVHANSVNTTLQLALGTRRVTTLAIDSTGVQVKATVYITVK